MSRSNIFNRFLDRARNDFPIINNHFLAGGSGKGSGALRFEPVEVVP